MNALTVVFGPPPASVQDIETWYGEERDDGFQAMCAAVRAECARTGTETPRFASGFGLGAEYEDAMLAEY